MKSRKKLCLLLFPVIILLLYFYKNAIVSNTAKVEISKITEITASSYKEYNSDGISFWMYVPPGKEDTQGLPMHLFLVGDGEKGNNTNNNSLGKAIKSGKIKPSGIVIIPKFSGTNYYDNNYSFLKKVKAVLNRIANQYGVDRTRISASGHSRGGSRNYIYGHILSKVFFNSYTYFTICNY